MEVLNKGREKLFETLGKLFYAIAACDGHIHELETLQLKQLVKFKWMSLSKVEGESEDAAVRIESEFDFLVSKSKDAASCFNEFCAYYENNIGLFTSEIKNLTFNTAYSIANAFEGINDDEKKMLKNLYNKIMV